MVKFLHFFIISIFLLLSFILLPGVNITSLDKLDMKKAEAIPALNFGGRILTVIPCTCSGTLLVTVGPPKPGVFVYVPGASFLYSFYQIYKPGSFVLGNYIPGGICLASAKKLLGTKCIPLPNMGTITQVGTSLY